MNDCAGCGMPLQGNAKKANKEWNKEGYLPYCVECQQKYFSFLSRHTAANFALFYNCVAFNTPFRPEIAKTMKPIGEVWKRYLQTLAEKKKNLREDGEPATFADGETNIQEALSQALNIEEDNFLIDSDNYLTQEELWVEKWGADLSKSEYETLDRYYKNQSAEYKGTISARMDINLRRVCKFLLEQDKCIKNGDLKGAKTYQDMIKSIFDLEGMKATDAKAVEKPKIDTIIVGLEEKGYATNGKLLSYEALIERIKGENGKYKQSLDCVDEQLFAIINTMRKNNGQSELTELPIEAQVRDEKNELLRTMTADEKGSMKELGVMPPHREGKL